MASEQDRREFGLRNADSVAPPLPSIPKVPKAIKDIAGGRLKKDWDRFESDWEEWRKKVTLPTIPAAVLAPATSTEAPLRGPPGLPGAPGQPGPPGAPSPPVVGSPVASWFGEVHISLAISEGGTSF